MKRVFFGLEPDAETCRGIADWRDRQTSCDGQAVPAANFHITLAFVGELDDAALERLSRAADVWFAQGVAHGGALTINDAGYWPRPGIFWLGPTHWPESLQQLSQKLGLLAGAVGSKRDRRPFHPHITLYRRCRIAPAAPLQLPTFTLRYRHCTLFESRQGRQGVSYQALLDWPLESAND